MRLTLAILVTCSVGCAELEPPAADPDAGPKPVCSDLCPVQSGTYTLTWRWSDGYEGDAPWFWGCDELRLSQDLDRAILSGPSCGHESQLYETRGHCYCYEALDERAWCICPGWQSLIGSVRHSDLVSDLKAEIR